MQRYFVPSIRHLKRLQSASKSPIFSHFSETQAGVNTVKVFGGQKWAIKTMEDNINYFVYYYCSTMSKRWLTLRLELLGNLITILASVFSILAKNHLSAGMAGLSISISLSTSSYLSFFAVRNLICLLPVLNRDTLEVLLNLLDKDAFRITSILQRRGSLMATQRKTVSIRKIRSRACQASILYWACR